MLRGIFGQKKNDRIPLSKLPQLHSFVDVTVGAAAAPKSVSVESVGPKNIVTGKVGPSSGTAVFIYSNAAGKFRFSTRIIGTKGNLTFYEMPSKVDVITSNAGAQKRSAVRIDTIVPGMWRRAKQGKGFGEFAKANLRDISRGGCSLIIDYELPRGSQAEVEMVLKTGTKLVTLGEVMRTEQIATSGKWSHGLRFHGLSPADDRAIMEFINRRQSDLRSRGLA